MKLQAYILPNGIAGIEAYHWSDSDIGGNAPFVISESIISGYADISSIVNWWKFGRHAGVDYLQLYKQVASLAYAAIFNDWANFDNLSNDEKQIVCRLCIPPKSIRIALVGESQDNANWIELVQLTRASRILITEKMRECVSGYQDTGQLTKQQSDDFYKDTKDLLLAYQFANNNEFKQWLTSESGSMFFLTGYKYKDYYLPEIEAKLVDIIMNLNY